MYIVPCTLYTYTCIALGAVKLYGYLIYVYTLFPGFGVPVMYIRQMCCVAIKTYTVYRITYNVYSMCNIETRRLINFAATHDTHQETAREPDVKMRHTAAEQSLAVQFRAETHIEVYREKPSVYTHIHGALHSEGLFLLFLKGVYIYRQIAKPTYAVVRSSALSRVTKSEISETKTQKEREGHLDSVLMPKRGCARACAL